MRAPLAKASAAATNARGGLQKAPATPPITSALDAASPKRSAESTVCQPRSPAEFPSVEDPSPHAESRASTQAWSTPIVREISAADNPDRRRRSTSSSKQTSPPFSATDFLLRSLAIHHVSAKGQRESALPNVEPETSL